MIYVKAKDLRVGDHIYVSGQGPFRVEEVAVGAVNVAVRVPEIKNSPLQQHSLDTELLIADREPVPPATAVKPWLSGINYEWEPYTGKRRQVRAILADSNGVVRFVGSWRPTSSEAVFELAEAMGASLVNEPPGPKSGPFGAWWRIKYQRHGGIVSAVLVRDHTAIHVGPWSASDESALAGLAGVIGKHLDEIS